MRCNVGRHCRDVNRFLSGWPYFGQQLSNSGHWRYVGELFNKEQSQIYEELIGVQSPCLLLNQVCAFKAYFLYGIIDKSRYAAYVALKSCNHWPRTAAMSCRGRSPMPP